MKLNIMKKVEIQAVILRNNLGKSKSNGEPYAQILDYCREFLVYLSSTYIYQKPQYNDAYGRID